MRPSFLYFASLAATATASALNLSAVPGPSGPSFGPGLPIAPTTSLPVALPPVSGASGVPPVSTPPVPGATGLSSASGVPTDPSALLGNIQSAIQILEVLMALLKNQGIQIPGLEGSGVGSAPSIGPLADH